MPQKWNRESSWRVWSERRDKSLPKSADRFPPAVHDLLLNSLPADSKKRPSLREFEDALWRALKTMDAATEDGFRMQVEYMESLTSSDVEWPHMERRIMELRDFYSSI